MISGLILLNLYVLFLYLKVLSYSCSEYLGYTFSINSKDDNDMLKQIRTLYIRSNKPLYTVPLTLNYNYLEASVCHFTVIIYGLHTKNQHLINYVWLLITLIVMY